MVLLLAFSSTSTALNIPLLIAPGSTNAPGPSLDDSLVGFRWRQTEGATGYRLIIRQPETGETESDDFPGTADSGQVDLPGGRTYQWQLAALSGTEVAALSATNWFSIVAKPVRPVIEGIAPDPVPALAGAQLLILNGREFRCGCELVLRDKTTGEAFPNLKIAHRRNNQFFVTPNFSKAEGLWSVEVINPGGFSSGEFRFAVVAPQHLGSWHWWRSGWPWFWGCLAATTLSGIGLWRAYRRARLAAPLARAEGGKQEHDRLRRDLHDSVNDLNQISLLAGKLNLMAQSGAPAAEIREAAGDVSSAVVEAVNTLEDMVWAGRQENEELEHLVARLRQKVGRFREFNPAITCVVDFPVDVPRGAIRAEAGAHLLHLTSEALRNVARHAGATELRCQLTVQDGRLRLAITDNGKGFRLDGSRPTGRGLSNLRRRAEDLGGTFALRSASGEGTEVVVEIPLGDRNAA